MFSRSKSTGLLWRRSLRVSAGIRPSSPNEIDPDAIQTENASEDSLGELPFGFPNSMLP
jgi:hypothetical protein